MNTEKPLNDLELKALRAGIRCTGSITDENILVGGKCYGSAYEFALTTSRDAARAALPAPEAESGEIVLEPHPSSYELFIIRMGKKTWCPLNGWNGVREGYGWYKESAELIRDGLIAREKAKRPQIRAIKKNGIYPKNWDVVCGEWERNCYGEWIKSGIHNHANGGWHSESEARALAAKLIAEGNYPPATAPEKAQ